MLEALDFDDYDLPTAKDIRAFRGALEDRKGEPKEIVFIAVAKWFDRTVAQRIFRHSLSGDNVGHLVAIDVLMILLTRGHVMQHCSLELYASHFPSFSTVCTSDLLRQAKSFGRVLDKFVLKYAGIRDEGAARSVLKELELFGVRASPMVAEDWTFLSRLERDWTVP